MTVEVRYYVNRAGRNIFDEWVSELVDRRAQAKITLCIDRLTAGNFGDCRSLGHGLYELRIDWGPGYRVYYAPVGSLCVLLLCGGDKRKQASDNGRARAYLKDYRTRTESDDAED